MANDAVALIARLDAPPEPPIIDVLPQITIPCLLYVGEADPRFTGVKDAANEVPNAVFFSLPGLNHVQGLRRGDLVLPRAKEFLGRVQQEVGVR